MNLGLIETAYAQGGKTQPSMLEMLVMPLALLVIFFFLVIRPQMKRQKEQEQLLAGLKVGDEVVTSAGIIGRVKAVADQFVTLEAGPSTTFKVQKSHITSTLKAKTAEKA